MRHQQYRESLLEALRLWRLSNPEGMIADARRELRPKLKKDDIDLLFDNWLNANFDKIEIKELKPGAVTAIIRKRAFDPDLRRRQDVLINKIKTRHKSNLFDEFAARIWETALPNGVVLRDATGKDLKHATGWFGSLAQRLKPNEKVIKKFSTRQLFDLSQRGSLHARSA